jgi:hypothetical protein
VPGQPNHLRRWNIAVVRIAAFGSRNPARSSTIQLHLQKSHTQATSRDRDVPETYLILESSPTTDYQLVAARTAAQVLRLA